MWLAISSDGELTRAQMIRDLEANQYCPVMYYMKDGQRTVPLFQSASLATQFARRNTPRNFSVACMQIEAEARQLLLDDGFVFEEITWPNRRETMVHVIYFQEGVTTHACGWRNDRVIRDEIPYV